MRSRRLTVLVTMAVMLVMMVALAGMVQAQPVAGADDAKCLDLARQTLGGFGQNINPANYTFVGGTEGQDDFTGKATEGKRDVFCGFGGRDYIDTLDEGDVFLGGAGYNSVSNNYGTFYGGDNTNFVIDNYGTFHGGAESDYVHRNHGTFYGGAGDDVVVFNHGTFYGGEGYDQVGENYGTLEDVED